MESGNCIIILYFYFLFIVIFYCYFIIIFSDILGFI